MQSPRQGTNGPPGLASSEERASSGRGARTEPARRRDWFGEGEQRPLEIVLVTLREGLAQQVAMSLRHDPRCRLSRGDPVRTLQGAGPDEVDAVILDHVLYNEIYLNDLNRAARRAVVLALLERAELLSASEFLVRADGFLFADGQADHAFDVIACAMVGYCAMPGELGVGNPFSSQRLQRARALGTLDMQILRMLGRGWSNREIALAVGISEARVKAALRALLHKLSLANRTEAAVFYVYNRGILDPDLPAASGSENQGSSEVR
ncbi:response regulator transcription factor [Rhodovibrio salinarum]|uniref:DNA-binding response regulator n=1 Tax=Rhodovibrio salinarum TaxID=1087 RepID=A0A934UZ64_9PROT|nr:LuxR C-terminal-related transcriptional regulator [Rhodovibrio salinarum]MBK1696055.1 DNA-binding response regulator [Rhodovibrio salinarum]